MKIFRWEDVAFWLLVIAACYVGPARSHDLAPTLGNGVDSCQWFGGSKFGTFPDEPGGAQQCFAFLVDQWNADPCPVDGSGPRTVTIGLGAIDTGTNQVVITRAHCWPSGNPPPSDLVGSYSVTQVSTCPSGHTLTGGTCLHTAVCAAPGTVIAAGIFQGGVDSPVRSSCHPDNGGCTAVFSGSMLGRQLVGGVYQYFWQGGYSTVSGGANGTGETCSEGTQTPSPLTAIPPASCGPGEVMGLINGVPTCFSSTTADPVNPHNGEPTNDPEVVIQTLPNGNTETTTRNPDGTVNTTETTPGGEVVKNETTGGDPLKTLCEQNPQHESCRRSSFAGNCAAGFQCEGDAASCAAARASNELKCMFENDPTKTGSALVTAAGLDGSKAGFDAGKTTTALPGLQFNQRTLAAASCPAPLELTVLGASISFSWQIFCDIAGIVSVFLMVGAMVLAARIVIGGF